MKKIAVVLFNLGGPKTQADVRPFLFNLFKDPYIIGLPYGLRHAIAGLIAFTRTKSAKANYALMGGGSPILAQTQAQAEALQTRLGETFRVFVGMRYWHPFIEEVVADIDSFQPDEIVLLPLYPQYSTTTTLTAFKAFERAYRDHAKGDTRVRAVQDYPLHPLFISAHQQLIHTSLSALKDPSSYRLLFSAHGLPEKTVAAGDPYQTQVEETVAAIMAEFKGMDHVICYQSRVGPLKWIGPSTEDSIRQTAKENKNVLLIPVAFVSEHIETLVELDIEYAHLAKEAGIREYVRVPALGTHSHYIAALADLVETALQGEG